MSQEPFFYKSQVHAPLIWVLLAVIGFCWLFYNRTDEPINIAPRETNLHVQILKPGKSALILNGPAHAIDKTIFFAPKINTISGENYEANGVLYPINKDKSQFEEYLYSQNIDFIFKKIESIQKTKDAPWLAQKYSHWNEKLSALIETTESEPTKRSILLGMLLGNRQLMAKDLKDKFRVTGSLHLFAISGLHVGIIAGVLAWLLKFIPIRWGYRALTTLALLYFYVQVTGGAASAMRAFYMIAFYWLGRAVSRKPCIFNALIASAIFALVLEPRTLWDIGFQLSYCVVGSIILIGLPLAENFNNWLKNHYAGDLNWPNKIEHHGLKFFGQLLIFSTTAWLGSVPISVGQFGLLTVSSIFLSIFLIPLASGAIVLGFVSLILGLLQMPWINTILNLIAMKLIGAMLYIVDLGADWTWGYWTWNWRFNYIPEILITLLAIYCLLGHSKNLLNKKRFYLIPFLGIATLLITLGYS